MANVRAVVTRPDGVPMQGVKVEFVSTDTMGILDLQTTDAGGEVNASVSGPFFVRARVSGDRHRILVTNFSNYMNVDYVVDSNGFGTHTTLFGSGGAFEQAVDDQADRVIWVCTTHQETQTASVNLSGLASGQQIVVLSGGPYRPSITANMNSAFFTQPSANSGTLWRYIFKGLNWVAAAGKTPTIFQPNAGVSAAPIEFVDCNFEGAGTWQYGIDLTGSGSAASGGMVFDNCRGTLKAFARLSSGGAALGPMIVRDCQMTIQKFVDRGASTDFEAGTSYMFTDNVLVVTGSAPFQATHLASSNIRITITGNDINYTGTSNLFQFGTAGSSAIRDVLCATNNIYCSSAGAVAIAFVGPGATPIDNVNVSNNVIRGPGSGTAISSSGIGTITTSVFQPNSFRGWGTNISSTLVTSFPGPTKFGPTLEIEGNADSLSDMMLLLDATGTAWSGIRYQRSGVDKAHIGLWNTSGVSPFDANDLYFAVNDGSWHDVMALDNSDYRVKVNTTLGVKGWIRAGSMVAPGNTADGDLTFVQAFVNNDSNFKLSVVSSNPRITLDSGDWFQYLRASNRFEWSIGSTNVAELDGNGDLRVVGYVRIGSLTAPANTSDADFTAGTLSLFNAAGSDTARGASTGYIFNVNAGLTDTSSGAKVVGAMGATVDPAGASASEFRMFVMQSTVPAGNAQNFSGPFEGIFALNTLNGSGNSTSTVFGGLIGLLGIGYNVASAGADNGGTISKAAGVSGLGINTATAATGKTLTLGIGLLAPNPSAIGSVTVSTYIGVDIEALSRFTVGTGRIGLRNADTTVFTPSAGQNITAVGATISPNASVVRLIADASYTLTSTPTIPDGVNGQILIVVNVDSTDTITLQDQGTLAGSNLRLSANTIALAPRDSIILMFSSDVGDWVQIGQTNVL